MLTFSKSVLAVAVMTTFGAANATTYYENATLTDQTFTSNITAINGATVTVTGNEISAKRFTATNHYNHINNTTYTYNQSKVILGNSATQKITLKNHSTGFVSGLTVNGLAIKIMPAHRFTSRPKT